MPTNLSALWLEVPLEHHELDPIPILHARVAYQHAA